MLYRSLYFYNPATPVTAWLCEVVNKKPRQPVTLNESAWLFFCFLYHNVLALIPLYAFFFPDHFFEILYRHSPVAVFLLPCQPFDHMQAVPLLEDAFRKRQTVDFQNKMVKTLVYTGVLLCYCFLDVSPRIRIFTTVFLLTSLTILLLRLSSA